MKKRVTHALLAVLLVGAAATVARAHEQTFKGTVITVKEQKIEVLVVVDEKAKKDKPMVFEVTPATKVYRGTAEVKFADAHISKDERIAVTINNDVPGQKATVIRLAAH